MKATRFVISNYYQTSSVTKMVNDLDYNKLPDRRICLTLLFKIIHRTVAIPAEITPTRLRTSYPYKYKTVSSTIAPTLKSCLFSEPNKVVLADINYQFESEANYVRRLTLPIHSLSTCQILRTEVLWITIPDTPSGDL